jgi:hypothetical protein
MKDHCSPDQRTKAASNRENFRGIRALFAQMMARNLSREIYMNFPVTSESISARLKNKGPTGRRVLYEIGALVTHYHVKLKWVIFFDYPDER